jgi:integrase/recombinase XerD
MTLLAPTLQGFFTERLLEQLHASPHTIASYRDTFRLLLTYLQNRTGTPPSRLDFDDLDASIIGAFLEHLEHDRGNCAATRNNRLAAIHSLFRYAALKAPEHAALIQRVLAIPGKRTDTTIVSFLTRKEVDALLASPDRATWLGRRDHALLLLTVQTGLRVSELIALRCQDVELGTGAHLHCHGKRRKQRRTPLTAQTVAALRTWMRELDRQPASPLFPSHRGTPLSRDGVARLVAKHASAATTRCPSLRTKHVTPHVLRHTNAMALLAAGVDTAVIALWLGHESIETTQKYLHADLALKERALARTTPPNTRPGRYRAPDTLLAFLESV